MRCRFSDWAIRRTSTTTRWAFWLTDAWRSWVASDCTIWVWVTTTAIWRRTSCGGARPSGPPSPKSLVGRPGRRTALNVSTDSRSFHHPSASTFSTERSADLARSRNSDRKSCVVTCHQNMWQLWCCRTIRSEKTPLLAPVAVNEELHSSKSDRSCRHIEFRYQRNKKSGQWKLKHGRMHMRPN